MGKILKNSVEYASTFLGRFKGKIVSETPPTDAYDWDVAGGPPATAQYYTGFEIQDAQQDRISNIDSHVYTNGDVNTVIGARKTIDGQTYQNQVYITVKNDGSRAFGFDDAGAFRSALGIGDRVIEQGTSGIWTYRKWSSGIAECWGVKASTSYAITGTWGQGKYASTSQAYPSGLFTAAPVVTINKYGSGAGLVWASVNSNTASQVNFYVCDTSSQTVSCQFSLYAIGRWQ